MDLLVLVTMKNVVKCDNWCELHYFVNHLVFERSLCPAAMPDVSV